MIEHEGILFIQRDAVFWFFRLTENHGRKAKRQQVDVFHKNRIQKVAEFTYYPCKKLQRYDQLGFFFGNFGQKVDLCLMF